MDALDGAFYLAFENAPTTGKQVLLALDVSGSMDARILGMDYLSCQEGCGSRTAFRLVGRIARCLCWRPRSTAGRWTCS